MTNRRMVKAVPLTPKELDDILERWGPREGTISPTEAIEFCRDGSVMVSQDEGEQAFLPLSSPQAQHSPPRPKETPSMHT